MDDERWKRVDDLLQSALQLSPDAREPFVRQACADDTALAEEVRSLLSADQNARGFLQQPVAPATALPITSETRAADDDLSGRTISHYRVLRQLDRGGMGMVYEAEDLRLGRHVALKLVLDSEASEKGLLRFEKEARALSSLNHPNICTVFEVEEHEAKPVIVMELLEGETLKERLQGGGVTLPQLMQWGMEITDALQAAHARGLIHRDIKPANVFITTRGTAKILDFGLAKLTGDTSSTPLHDESLTAQGVIAGTTPYMSPEQVRGDDLDGRTDVFSVGVVLYEMATGRNPFHEKRFALTLDAVLNRRPVSPREINQALPKELERIIEKSLEKNRDRRYQGASEMRGDLLALQQATDRSRPALGPLTAEPSVATATLEAVSAPTSPTSTSGPRRRTRWTFVLSVTAGGLLLALVATWRLLDRRDYFWRNPLDDATFQNVTDFGGTEQAAAVSRDGRFVAFLSDRDGRMDVWVTQVGAGQSYNLTRGRFQGLGNPSLRVLGFSPDDALVTFWARGLEGSNASEISVWAVPTLGGQPRPYLEGVAEYDWSDDGSRLVYHTPGPGDPTFVKEAGQQTQGQQIFAAPAGLHAHFQVLSPNGDFIYFVQGTPPDAMDIWRIRPTGGAAERITHHNSRVSYPVFLNQRTLMYVASDADGSGPWLHSLDVEHRVSHLVGGGLDRYTSLAASADGRRLVATHANLTGTLWRLRTADTPVDASAATPISLTTARGFSPRLGPDYLVYVSSKGRSDGIWKLADGAATEIWNAPDARIIGGPEVSPDGHRVAFSVERGGKTLLYAMNADGTNTRLVTESLEFRGAPAWTPDGQSITSAANVKGTPQLFRISLDGRTIPLLQEYSVDPVWSPGGDFLVYSGADIGTAFQVKAVTATASPYPFPNLTLTRGARRLRFFQGRRALVVMRGDIQHKNLWLIDLDTGAERQLTNLALDFNVRDFDVSRDGSEIVLERVQERSDVVLIDLARHD